MKLCGATAAAAVANATLIDDFPFFSLYSNNLFSLLLLMHVSHAVNEAHKTFYRETRAKREDRRMHTHTHTHGHIFSARTQNSRCLSLALCQRHWQAKAKRKHTASRTLLNNVSNQTWICMTFCIDTIGSIGPMCANTKTSSLAQSLDALNENVARNSMWKTMLC